MLLLRALLLTIFIFSINNWLETWIKIHTMPRWTMLSLAQIPKFGQNARGLSCQALHVTCSLTEINKPATQCPHFFSDGKQRFILHNVCNSLVSFILQTLLNNERCTHANVIAGTCKMASFTIRVFGDDVEQQCYFHLTVAPNKTTAFLPIINPYHHQHRSFCLSMQLQTLWLLTPYAYRANIKQTKKRKVVHLGINELLI